MATPKRKTQDHPLDQFAAIASAHMDQAAAILLWKNRHANPDMSIQVTEQDITKLQACAAYLKVTPEVRVYRPKGLPGKDPIPAQGQRRAIPGTPATPPKNYVVIQLVDQDGNGFVPIENNEDDAKLRDEARARKRMKDRAPMVAEAILAELQAGAFTDGTLKEAAQILQDLAKAVP